MKKSIIPGSLKGTIEAPGSKSEFQRVAILSLFNQKNELKITNASLCDDELSAIEFLRESGMLIYTLKNNVYINKAKFKFPKRVNIKESGLLARMLSSVLLLDGAEHRIDGIGTLLQRDMSMVIDSLNNLDVSVKSNGKLPITVKGPLKPGAYFLDGSKTSQFITGVLITLSQLDGNSTLKIKHLISRNYVDLTIQMMTKMGMKVKSVGDDSYMVEGNQKAKISEITISGDWSSAANILVGGLISGDVKINGISRNSIQPDRVITDIFDDNDIKFEESNDQLRIKKQEYNGFEFNADDCPDLIPILVVMALNANSKSRITGIDRLRYKESDRAEALIKEFAKLDVDLKIEGNSFVVKPQKIKGGEVDSHSDHRIVMAFSIASLIAKDPIVIKGAESVAKSYPLFFNDLELLGIKTSE